MKLRRIVFALIILTNSIFAVANVVEEQKLDADEFNSKLEVLEKRYEDFFKRQIQIKRERDLRQQAATEQRKIRNERFQQVEKLRREYVKNRKVKDSLERHLPEYEREQKKIADHRKKLRKDFIAKRNQLHRILVKSKKIPEKKEYGIKD